MAGEYKKRRNRRGIGRSKPLRVELRAAISRILFVRLIISFGELVVDIEIECYTEVYLALTDLDYIPTPNRMRHG